MYFKWDSQQEVWSQPVTPEQLVREEPSNMIYKTKKNSSKTHTSNHSLALIIWDETWDGPTWETSDCWSAPWSCCQSRQSTPPPQTGWWSDGWRPGRTTVLWATRSTPGPAEQTAWTDGTALKPPGNCSIVLGMKRKKEWTNEKGFSVLAKEILLKWHCCLNAFTLANFKQRQLFCWPQGRTFRE